MVRAHLFAVVCAVLLGGSLAAPGFGLTPYLVKDIDSSPSPASSVPHQFRRFGRLGLFDATDGETPAGFWRSDGTATGTYPLVADCGNCRTSETFFVPDPSPFSFWAAYTDQGSELWVSRGTPASTARLARFASGLPFSGPAGVGRWVPEQGRLYFTPYTTEKGWELWTSDGTAAGTYKVTDLAFDAEPINLIPFRGELYFSARVAGHGGLFKSDGTMRGTVEVGHFGPAALPTARPFAVAVLGSRLLFFEAAADFGLELWSSDGTAAGTVAVTEALPGSLFPNIYDWEVVGSRLVVLVVEAHGQSLWATDGTRKNTRKLVAFKSTQAISSYLMPQGNRVYFSADDGVHGRELWQSDGTPTGTRLVVDACPGPCSSGAAFLGGVGGVGGVGGMGGKVIFSADDGVHGYEPWVTDGTRAGTALLRDLCPGRCESDPYAPQVVGNLLFFAAVGPPNTPELWRTDGTAAGTVRVAAFPGDPGLWNNGFEGVATATQLLFVGEDATHGRELWRSDGTRAGTHLVSDIAPANLGGAFPGALSAAGDRLYFFLGEGGGSLATTHAVLWTSDGTDAGTVRVKDFGAGVEPPSKLASTALGRRLFFIYSAVVNDPALWTSDGTEGGTVRLTPPGLIFGAQVATLGGTVLFLASAPGANLGSNLDLWRSDGTPEGTVPVVPTGAQYSTATQFTVLGDQLYFFQPSDPSSEGTLELWRTDGTAAGTVQVADLHTPVPIQSPPLAVLLGRLYFFAQADPADPSSLGLWSSDGTPAGTHAVSTFGLGPTETLVPQGLAVAGGKLFISAYTPAGSTLWASDGTDSGTRQIGTAGFKLDFQSDLTPADFAGRLFFVAPGPDSTSPGELWASDGTAAGTAPFLDAQGAKITSPQSLRTVAGTLTFATADGFSPPGLWQSDGTAAGTREILSLGPSYTGYRGDLTVAGSLLFFSAYDYVHGTELWAARP